jgi:hypothetical protein
MNQTMKLNAIVIGFLFFLPFVSFSKNLTITGKILDQKTNEPIAYANIAIAGTYTGMVSNEMGEFRLVIPDKYFNKSVTFNSIVYENSSLPTISMKGNLNILLKTIDFPIAEVVVMPDSTLTIFFDGVNITYSHLIITFKSIETVKCPI